MTTTTATTIQIDDNRNGLVTSHVTPCSHGGSHCAHTGGRRNGEQTYECEGCGTYFRAADLLRKA